MEAYVDAKKAEEKEDFPTDEEEEEEEEVEEADEADEADEDSDVAELADSLQKNFMSDYSSSSDSWLLFTLLLRFQLFDLLQNKSLVESFKFNFQSKDRYRRAWGWNTNIYSLGISVVALM